MLTRRGFLGSIGAIVAGIWAPVFTRTPQLKHPRAHEQREPHGTIQIGKP